MNLKRELSCIIFSRAKKGEKMMPKPAFDFLNEMLRKQERLGSDSNTLRLHHLFGETNILLSLS